MTEIIKKEIEAIEIGGCKLELSKMFISDTKKVEVFAKELESLGKIVLDFSTKDKIKEAKELRTQANKFVEKLKEFCEPLEAEGQRIKDARSLISTKLNKSKSSVIEALLAPIDEREEKLKSIKAKVFTPSLDANSNAAKLAEIESLKDYNWLGFSEEALALIEQHKQFISNEKIKFDEQERLAKEAAEKARLDREEAIRIEAEAKAKLAAQKEIDDANARAEKAKSDAEIKIEEIKKEISKDLQELPRVATNSFYVASKEHQAKIHNEIAQDLLKYFDKINEEQAKDIVRLFAQGKIRNLKITY
jgi:hypothetical protein